MVVKRFLKLPNLHMLIKEKSPSLLRNLVLRTFGELLIAILLLTDPEVLSSASKKAKNCWLTTFLRTLTLMTWVSLYLFSLQELI